MEHQLQTALKGLKMPGMAACWQSMEETHQSEKLSLRDGLQILIQAEKDSRDSNRIAKLIKNANFRIQALIEELEISETRGVPADIILQLSSGEYIKAGSTVIICGATGTGKSYLACALGNKACRLGYKVVLPGSKNTVKMGIGVQQNREQEYSKNGNKNTVISINIINQGLHCIINKKQDCDGLKNKITYHYVSRDSQAS